MQGRREKQIEISSWRAAQRTCVTCCQRNPFGWGRKAEPSFSSPAGWRVTDRAVRHFPDKQTLLAGIAIEGFKELATRLTQTSKTNAGGEERFIELDATYVGFAQDFPVHYQLMFGAVLGDFSASRELQEASASAYTVLDATLTEIKSNQQLEHDVAMLGGLVWSTVHGMASLVFNVPMAQLPKGADEAPRQAVKSIHEDMRATLKMVYLGITS